MIVRWSTVVELRALGLDDLARNHWAEAEHDLEEVPLDLDFDHMCYLEREQCFKVAALLNEGALVGYAGFTLMPSMFHKSTLHAFCDAVYVKPEHRGYGLKLLRWAEDALANMGVKKVYIASRPKVELGRGKRLGDLLAHLSYCPAENTYSKLIGEPHVRRTQSPNCLPADRARCGGSDLPVGHERHGPSGSEPL